MKLNWGHKLTIFITLFIIIMLSMVYIAFQQTNEMVDNNYYEKEIKYQNLIDASKNLNNISTNDVVLQSNNKLYLQIPKSLIDSFKNGTYSFTCNSSEAKDFTSTFTVNKNGTYEIVKTKIEAGKYIAKISWSYNNKDYYKEQTINLN